MIMFNINEYNIHHRQKEAPLTEAFNCSGKARNYSTQWKRNLKQEKILVRKAGRVSIAYLQRLAFADRFLMRPLPADSGPAHLIVSLISTP